jgi:ribosomal protein S18 acetylase RimI-like enzyme
VPIHIRKAEPADLPCVLSCLREAFEPYRERYTAGAFLDTILTEDLLIDRLTHMSIFVAVDLSVAGTIACGHGHLRGMAVRPSSQGCGVAALLLRAAEKELQESGCRRVTLDTTAPLERAIRFYEAHGYSRTGRVQDFFGMPLFEYAKEL